MMNEEQLEASMVGLAESCRRSEIAHGWKFGKLHETRRGRIKRTRRWRKIEGVFPDKIGQRPLGENKFLSKPELVFSKSFPGFEVMITGFKRRIMPGLDAPEWVWRDMESWDEIQQYNGYCRFMSKPVMEPGYKGILNYVPVHGGVTYASLQCGVATYGFDTAHADDEKNPQVRNLEWMEFQAWFMAKAIRLAALYEPEYLRTECPYQRARIIDSYHGKVRKLTQQLFVIGNNFGAMLNLLCGKL